MVCTYKTYVMYKQSDEQRDITYEILTYIPAIYTISPKSYKFCNFFAIHCKTKCFLISTMQRFCHLVLLYMRIPGTFTIYEKKLTLSFLATNFINQVLPLFYQKFCHFVPLCVKLVICHWSFLATHDKIWCFLISTMCFVIFCHFL